MKSDAASGSSPQGPGENRATLSARVIDPAGPRWWRVAAAVGLVPLALLGLALPLSALARVELMLAGVAWLALGRLVVPRLRGAPCVVETEPGAVSIRRAGARTQRIRASDLRAASTAAAAEGDGRHSLALVRYGHGDWPMWLAMQDAADVDRVRRALGVGHAGFGALEWPPRGGSFHVWPSVLDVVAAAAWLVVAVAALLHAEVVAFTGALGAFAATVAALAAAASTRAHADAIQLSPYGLTVVAPPSKREWLWREVRRAHATAGGVMVETAGGDQFVPLRRAGAEERALFAAQIDSAAARARGEGPPPPAVPASLAVLAPRDESARTWLERVDTAAATCLDPAGYRQTGVEEDDLWTALERPDVPGPIRAAAARILARVRPYRAGPRIAQVLAQEHSESVRTRIRAALEEDVSVAARQLEELDPPDRNAEIPLVTDRR